ncbi:hypothetical protein, partial [Castellaniella sp.]|uniref:hypothetical protein n=1 Tax=Castellaniella sp. TaxID=1955812 RepID=UPI002AFE64A5
MCSCRQGCGFVCIGREPEHEPAREALSRLDSAPTAFFQEYLERLLAFVPQSDDDVTDHAASAA